MLSVQTKLVPKPAPTVIEDSDLKIGMIELVFRCRLTLSDRDYLFLFQQELRALEAFWHCNGVIAREAS